VECQAVRLLPPGRLVTAELLYENNPDPMDEDCEQALTGIIFSADPRHPCAIMKAAENIQGGT